MSGLKATCPACDATTTSIGLALQSGELCPYCGDSMLYSKKALAQQAAADAREARGEAPNWQDFFGLLEPNPDLPNCQSQERHAEVQCSLPNHHEGPHRAELEW